jgi:hypothetical protein
MIPAWPNVRIWVREMGDEIIARMRDDWRPAPQVPDDTSKKDYSQNHY